LGPQFSKKGAHINKGFLGNLWVEKLSGKFSEGPFIQKPRGKTLFVTSFLGMATRKFGFPWKSPQRSRKKG